MCIGNLLRSERLFPQSNAGLVRPWTVSGTKWSATLFRFPVLLNKKATKPRKKKKKELRFVATLFFCDFGEVAACGGEYRARTCDPLLVRQMLSQLS